MTPLPAKTKKEVNIISKYFYPKKLSVENTVKGNNVNPGKSYAQASKLSVSTSDMLKIKKTFPSLNAQKIDQVNSIVNSQNKSKPQIRMTTKVSQIRYLLVVILELNGGSEVQYKDMMMVDDRKYQ